jgi:hypothetical protein
VLGHLREGIVGLKVRPKKLLCDATENPGGAFDAIVGSRSKEA